MTDIEAELLIAQAEIKSLKKELNAAIDVLDDICEKCSWITGSKECIESGCPIAQWRKAK